MKYLFIFFATRTNLVPDHFKSEYSVFIRPFVQGFDHDMLSAWSIHRWYNLKPFKEGIVIFFILIQILFFMIMFSIFLILIVIMMYMVERNMDLDLILI